MFSFLYFTTSQYLYVFYYRWQEELAPCQVLLMPPAVFSLLLTDGVLSLTQINLIVLDECQNINIPNHPYVQIMERYKVCLKFGMGLRVDIYICN